MGYIGQVQTGNTRYIYDIYKYTL